MLLSRMNKFRTVVCGISGGVDSAVSALLLKKQGFNVIGAFMRNWDLRNEVGVCTADQDLEDAEYVCQQLDIPLHQVNFVKEYWMNVFSPMIDSYESGTTPNPDVLCNRHIKFDAYFEHVTRHLGADAVATGHYARNSFGKFLQNYDPNKGADLLTSGDPSKDQTLFLCQVKQAALHRTMFPVGDLTKDVVKKIATQAGLQRIVKKKESMGICFIGTRHFHDFIEEYVEPKPGNFVDIDTGQVVGKHKGTHYWTVGQRSLIGGLSRAYFVVNVDPKTQDIHVAQGTNHPALFTTSMTAETPHWINRKPTQLAQTGSMKCWFRFQHVHPLMDCVVREKPGGVGVEVELERPLRAITPGQYAVLYDGEVCLGGARITRAGPSLWDLDQREPAYSDTQS